MFGFIKKAVKSVTSVAKVVTKVIKPVAAGVAIVYPPAAPIAAGVLVADKALNAIQPPPKAGSPALAKVTAMASAKLGRPVSQTAVQAALARRFAKRSAAGKRIIANTAQLAAKGDVNAARGMTLIVKRAAARREAAHWKVRDGRVVRA
jgi:hypothetical protein